MRRGESWECFLADLCSVASHREVRFPTRGVSDSKVSVWREDIRFKLCEKYGTFVINVLRIFEWYNCWKLGYFVSLPNAVQIRVLE